MESIEILAIMRLLLSLLTTIELVFILRSNPSIELPFSFFTMMVFPINLEADSSLYSNPINYTQ